MSNIFEEVILASQSSSTGLTENKKSKKRRTKKLQESCCDSTKLVEDEYEDIDTSDVDEDSENVEDEVLTIVDPELSVEDYESEVEAQEVPTEDGDSVLFSDEHIDDTVMTCPICGANYFEDEIDPEDNVCPVCGSEREPVVLGTVEVPDEIDDAVVVTTDEDEVEDIQIDDEEDTQVDEDDTEYEAVNDNEYEEEVVESVRRKSLGRKRMTESESLTLRKPVMSGTSRVGVKKPSDKGIFFEDRAMNALLNRFLKENYQGLCSAKIEKAISKGNNLILECKVLRGKKVHNTKFITENYRGIKSKRLEFREEGLFTESTDKSKAFIVECVAKNNAIIPTSMKYKYRVVEDKKTYQVEGRCLLESKKRK